MPVERNHGMGSVTSEKDEIAKMVGLTFDGYKSLWFNSTESVDEVIAETITFSSS